MHATADAVTYKVTHYAVAKTFRIGLNGVRDVTEPIADYRLGDTFIERLFGYVRSFCTSASTSPTGTVMAASP